MSYVDGVILIMTLPGLSVQVLFNIGSIRDISQFHRVVHSLLPEQLTIQNLFIFTACSKWCAVWRP